MPVSSYAAELLQLFQLAIQREVRINLPSKAKATNLRYRLNRLRSDMRREHHSLANVANGVEFKIIKNEDGSAILIALPADNAYLEALHRAGVEAPKLPKTEEIKISSRSEDALKRFLEGDE